MRIGDPSLKPAQLTLNPASLTYIAEVGDTPLTVNVNAVKPDGGADSFTAVSSKPGVAAVSTSGGSLTITPAGAGTATITVTSGSDPTLQRTIAATISPRFVQPSQAYPLNGATQPAAAAPSVHVDSALKLTFDSPPTLGAGGSIRIFRKADDALVDVILSLIHI